MKWPFLKFYTRDWQSDPELRMCSLEARGFWLECLCIMHSAKRRGYLETPQGHHLSEEQIARLMATFKGDVLRCSKELIENGVPSIEEGTGVWYCRRMVKDSIKSQKCSEAAIRGGGNPNLSGKTPEAQNTRNQIPETRNHISLKVTFKGQILEIDQVEGIPSEAYDLASMLATNISRIDPGSGLFSDSAINATLSKWALDFGALNDAGRSWKEIKDVLFWVMGDKFWGTKITNAHKFREKFDDLIINSSSTPPLNPPSPPVYICE